MNFSEQPLRFRCHDCWLYGILSVPLQSSKRGILIVVGGPQYRIGSHRQFTLLARFLAAHDIPALRFDYRGMGDSDGVIQTFENIGDDLESAIDQFFLNVPSLKEVVIWGLCDAASAALFYAHKDQRVTGLVLVNPWVRTESGAAKAYLKHYYTSRLLDGAFWGKIIRGDFKLFDSFKFLFQSIKKSLMRKAEIANDKDKQSTCNVLLPLPYRMLEGLKQYTGKIFIITSGDDLTAKEFLDLINTAKDWRQILNIKQVKFAHLKDANHTFSSRQWRDQVAVWTTDWTKSW